MEVVNLTSATIPVKTAHDQPRVTPSPIIGVRVLRFEIQPYGAAPPNLLKIPFDMLINLAEVTKWGI